MSPVDDHLGPIDCFVVRFPTGTPTAAGFARIVELVEGAHIRILDVEFVSKLSGTVSLVDAATLGAATDTFVGASSGLVDDADLTLLAAELGDGELAAVILYEELSIRHAFDAFTDEGAEVVLVGHLSAIELDGALDATDAA